MKVKICPQCKTENRAEAVFCKNCRKTLKLSVAVRFIALGFFISAIVGAGWYFYSIINISGRANAKIKEAEKIRQTLPKFREGKHPAGYLREQYEAWKSLRLAKETYVAGNYAASLKYAKSAIQKAKKLDETARLESDIKYGRWFVEGEENLKKAEKTVAAELALPLYRRTLECFEKVLNCRPDDSASKEKIEFCKNKIYELLFIQGKNYAEKGNWEDAITSYQEALKYKPGDSKAENELKFVTSKKIDDSISKGKRYLNQKKYSDAVDEFQKAVNLGASGEVIGLLAEAKKKKRKWVVQKGEWSIIDDDLVIVGIGGGDYLMWPRNKYRAGCNNNGELNWSSAMSWARDLVYNGYDDWRLPTKDELKQLYDYGKTYITYSSSWYWSSSAHARTNFTWYVYFGNGYVGYVNKTDSGYVRPVRGCP
ncbi:MAG: DUF1566 domain-containing protein [bacterium]